MKARSHVGRLLAEPLIGEMIEANAAGTYFDAGEAGGGMRAYRIESFGRVGRPGDRDDPPPQSWRGCSAGGKQDAALRR
jgi:hypothetical protein